MPEYREGAGGFERGVEKIASGLTSPLSVALTAATFGTGGAIESAGATALKEAVTETGTRLFTDTEIPQIVKASEAAIQAFKDQKAIEPAVNAALEAGGHDLDLLRRAKEITSNLVPDTMFGEPAVQSVLEKAGLSDIQREALAKTSATIAKAREAFKPVEDAVREAGVDPALWKRGQDILYKNGLTEHDLIGGNLMERGSFQLIRKAVPTMPIAATARAAKTANYLLNAGFTYQQLEMGAQMSPQFLDALKSGDYDKAMEYGTEMVAGYGLGVLGATHALHSAGELFKPLIQEGAFRPNDEWLAVDRTNKEREAQHAVAEQHAIEIDQHARQLLGHEEPRAVLGDSTEVKALKNDELAETFAHAETGSDAEKAAAIASALRRADGRADEIDPNNGQPPTGTPIAPADMPPRAGTEVAHSNDAGQVRIGADGRPVVWLTPSAWAQFNHATEPGNPIKGVSFAPDEIGTLGRSLENAGVSQNKEIQELFQSATTLSKQGLLTTAAHPTLLKDQAIPIVSEELHHTWQRELSKDGDIVNHLDGATTHPDGSVTVAPGSQWDRLHGLIPAEWAKRQSDVGYDPSPVVRVVETAAQFLAGRAEGIISPEEQFKFIKEYFKEVEAKHGKDAFANLDKINEIARQHVEDIHAQTEAATRATKQGPVDRSVAGVQEGGRRPAGVGEAEPEVPAKPGLTARELHEDEVQSPIGFVSPNVHNLPNVQDAEFRLNSRPQKLAETLSKDFAEALPGVKAVVRPAIGHWEGGAENSTLQRFAPGTDPDAVEYHNAFITKAGYQNMGAGFVPGAGSDKLFQFRVPLSTADASQIGAVLEAHGIPGDTIEPIPGGHLVHIVSPGDRYRPQVAEVASRLDAGNIGETNGRAFQHGDYESRDAAQRVLDTRLAELESKHPTWGPVRKAFESRPDYVGLSKLTREPREPFVDAVHGTRAEGLDTVSPEKQFTGPQKGAERERAANFPKDYVKKSYWRVEGSHGEPFYERQPYQYKARFNNENLYPWVDDPDKLMSAAYQEAAARGIQGQRGAIGTIYERMMKDAGYDGYYHPGGEIATFKDTPVEQQMREGTSPLSGQVPALGLAARDFTAKEKEEFKKLGGLKLRAGMGEPGSAAIVTGKNKTFVGDWHEDLMDEAGIVPKGYDDAYTALFKAGGVRLRTMRGGLNVEFQKNDPDTVDRVYQSIASSPEAKHYQIEFIHPKGEKGFSASAGDKDTILRKLRDWDEGRGQHAAPAYGSVNYFRQNFSGLYSRDWNSIKKYLTDEEQAKHNTDEKKNSLVAAFNSLPDAEEWSDAVRAGRAGQMWYERSSRAFDALLDSGFDRLHPADKDKFLNFVAALSPVQPVKTNLVMAIEQWAKWDKAGRPTDVVWKDGKPNKSAKLYQMMRRGVDLQSRLGNAIRALQGEPLSGPKVSAFTKNLGEDVNRVTNDTWMAVLAGQDPGRINKPAVYDSMSAKVREAAEAHGIAPRQAQAAAWSFIKSLAELSGWGNDRWIPPQQIVKQGLLTPELVAAHSADFADLLQHDPQIRGLITKLGGDLNAFDEKLKSYVPERPAQGETSGVSDRLLNAAGRLEAARANSAIQRHLEAKSGPQSAFDFGAATDFNPAYMDQHIGGGTGIGAKYIPLYARDNPAPQWYLKSNQIIGSRMQGPMPADTVQKMLENNGVKPDEMKYTGLDEFLRSKGKEPVRPDEVRQYLAANNLQVQEVTKGADAGREEALRNDYFRLGDERSEAMKKAEASGAKADYEEVTRIGELERAALHRLMDHRDQPHDAPKFGTYTLPGGENYREMLLTLPQKTVSGFHVYNPANPNKILATFPTEVEAHRYVSSHLDEDGQVQYDYTANSSTEEHGNFRSSHWDEPNVVGHVRFNDRTGPNGEKLLHLEELQSDWHQKGRTQGYKSELTPEEEQRRYQVARERNVAAEERAYHRQEQDSTAFNEATSRMETLDRELESLNKKKNGGVPDAPFKKTWPELLMKRMVRYAAEHGYDGVLWTPGEDQATRYDLSKQISRVTYAPVDGTLRAFDHSGNQILTENSSPEKLPDYIGKEAANKLLRTPRVDTDTMKDGDRAMVPPSGNPDGKPVEVILHPDRRLNEGNPRESIMVSEVGGKENRWFVELRHLASHELSGVDLKVGGEGMRGFYDKIVPDLANKLGKQFGAKVGETKIDLPPSIGRSEWTYEGPSYDSLELIKMGNKWLKEGGPVSLPHQAQAIANDMKLSGYSFEDAMRRNGSLALAEKLGGKMNMAVPESKSVPYFPITDSMRESVLKQGQPLFARGGPDNGLPSNIDDMIRDNKFKNMPKEYKDRVIRAYERVASGTSPDRVLQTAKYLRDEQDKNWQLGSANDLLHNHIEDYMTRVYKDENPKGKLILSDSKQGKFATDVNMARQRVYDSTVTALLKSPKELFLDPVQTTAQGRAQLIKAAANRQLIDKLRDAGTRASDGRPAVVLSGTGRVVTGQNGEDPKTFIDPNRVRKINLSDDMVRGLKKNGDFDRFIADGTLKDITPYVHPGNIRAAIARLEDRAESKEAQYDQVGNNKLRTDLMYLKSMLNNNDFSGLKEFNDAQPKKYAWDPQDYISLDNGAMKGWNFVTNDSAGNGVLVRSDIKVHPEFAEYLKNRLGLNPSTIGQNPVGKALLGAGTKLKHTLLSLSPFHMVQIALRGVMTGVNPFTLHAPDLIHGAKIDPMDPNSPTKMYKMAEQGLTVGTDYRAMQEHSEGVSAGGGALRMIPGVGKVLAGSMDWFQDLLFRRYIPAIKATAAEHMFDEYQRLHPEWSTDKVAKMAATHANDSFGGINWKAMGRSATTQDWGRLMLLAPDWLESEMRSGVRLFNRDEGGLGRAQVAKMALGLWGIARVLNLLTTGNAHYEAPFGLAVKNKEGKETIFGIRTLPTDLLHAADDPVGFIKGRLSPTVRMGQELLTQRDQFGRKLAPEDMWVDIFRNMAPIAAQSIGQAVTGTGPEIGNLGQAWKASGGTAQVYNTPAQKLAAELASNHNEDGPVDSTQMARHRRVMQLEDQLRSGQITWPDLVKLTYQTDQLKESELKQIQNNFKKTQGIPPDMASLYTRAARLPAAEYLKLYDVLNPQEKAALATLTLQVQKRYLNKVKKEMTPAERAKDPTFNRFMRMIPQQQQQAAPQPQSSYTPPPTAQSPLQKEVAYLYTATHPQTGHRVGSDDGQNWFDHQTGEAVNG
jgi:hypothetical protein